MQQQIKILEQRLKLCKPHLTTKRTTLSVRLQNLRTCLMTYIANPIDSTIRKKKMLFGCIVEVLTLTLFFLFFWLAATKKQKGKKLKQEEDAHNEEAQQQLLRRHRRRQRVKREAAVDDDDSAAAAEEECESTNITTNTVSSGGGTPQSFEHALEEFCFLLYHHAQERSRHLGINLNLVNINNDLQTKQKQHALFLSLIVRF